MKLQVCLMVLLGAFALVHGLENKEDTRRHREKDVHRDTSHRDVGDQRKKPSSSPSSSFKLDEKSKGELIEDKAEDVFFAKQLEYFTKNPSTKMDRECFARNLKSGYSIDFVIDIAPSPAMDDIDKVVGESPIALYLQSTFRSASRMYFDSVRFFIEAVTIDMKPEVTHSVLFEHGRKFFIRGRDFEDVEWIEKLKSKGEFTDETRNLKTLWPVGTKEVLTRLRPVVKNNLGHLTELCLWNRDNGLPLVLASSRHSKPVYTIVITDGSSDSTLDQLTDDVSRTTVIDIGLRRFANKLKWEDMRRLGGIYTLNSPQQLPLMADSIRNMACLFSENVKDK
jgi:hypothetical protein